MHRWRAAVAGRTHPDPRRQRARRRGQGSERLCALWLRLKGYGIVGRNLRTPHGEVDILARRGPWLVVVEVKHRSDGTAARTALTPRQQARLVRAGQWLLGRQPAGLTLRFDLMTVAAGGRLHHLKGAWRPASDP